MNIKSKITLLVGENGSGKSTLLKAMMNVLHYEGDIHISGSCSYMPEFPSFPTDITVFEFLSTFQSEAIILPFLKQFHLITKKDVLISNLSKGMKGKLNVIQCLMEEAEWYLLDEPLNGLDYDGLQELINYIQVSSQNFIIATHNTSAFQLLQTDVIHLD